MRPSRSSPMTPAETPVSTVSVNRLRSSSWRLASTSSSRWLRIWSVMRLKARLRELSSSSLRPSGAHRHGRGDEAADRVGELGGEIDADRHRRGEKQRRHQNEDHRKGDLEARALSFELFVLRRGELGLA